MILKHISIKLVLFMAFLSFSLILVLLVHGGHGGYQLKPSTVPKCVHAQVNTYNSTLELVHIVMRHGARTPVDTYPNDPYLHDAFFPTGWGHLTNQGKVELYDLGHWLRKRYAKFLPSYYMPDTLHAQATASPRALMSLSTVLASFFAPRKTPMAWHSELNWQPIPILSEPLDQDSLLLVRTPCPRYAEARAEVLQLPEVKAEMAQHEELLRNLTELTGMPMRTAENVNSIYITLQAEEAFGFKLPEWTRDYYPDKMQFLAEQSYIYNAYTPEMQKIKGGPFVSRMFSQMQAKCLGKLSPSARKMFIYAGHDWTVGNILSALQVWERQMPRFAVTALFELHRNIHTDQCYVEIFLRNNEAGCAVPLTVPGCQQKCPLDQLLRLIEHVLPTDGSYEERCAPRNSSFIEPPARPIDQHA